MSDFAHKKAYMRAIGVLLLLLGLGGVGWKLAFRDDYNPVISGLLDQANGTPGLRRMEYEDQRANDTIWLGVWAFSAMVGVGLMIAAPKVPPPNSK